MLARITLLLFLVGCLAIGSLHFAAQEPDAETQAQIGERDQLKQQAMEQSTGDYMRAETLYDQAISNSLRHLDATASFLTEQQQIAMSRSLRYRLDNFVDCALAMDPQPQSLKQHLIAWKGAVLVRLRGMRQASRDPAIADKFHQLQRTTQRWSALTQNVPGPERLDTWQKQVAELHQQKEKLDAELMRETAVFRSAQQKVSLDEVRQSIPADGVIIDYFKYGTKQGRSLVATVVGREVDPVLVDLGSAEEAGQAICRWRSSLGASEEASQAGEQLRKQLWEPLLAHLGDARLVFVSTDGVLGQLPFAALPGKSEGKAQWLHLATHGFFAPPEMQSALSSEAIAKSHNALAGLSGDQKNQFLGYSPGQLSGLVFAGVNRLPKSNDPLTLASGQSYRQ